ncbi:MAG: tripartite tricarboxylate transporter substrate-binding protein [Reyranella sp.]
MNTPFTRRWLLATGTALAAPAIARAQSGLPHKPIRILVGYPSSGGSDSLVHIISGALQTQLSRNVTIDYKPGPSGVAAGEVLKKATPDGSTIAFMPSATMVGKLVKANFPFDPLTDLLPLTLAGTYPTAFAVSPRIDVTTLAEYVAWLKAGDATRARFGTTSPDSFTQYFGTLVGREIGAPLEAVPYNGARPLIADLEKERIPAGTAGITSFLVPQRGGRLKILMTSAAKRGPIAPKVPTVVELGFPNLVQTNWYAFFAPPGMPAALVAAWTAELRAVLQSREVSEQLQQLGLTVETSTPAEMAERLAADFKAWKATLDLLGIKSVN